MLMGPEVQRSHGSRTPILIPVGSRNGSETPSAEERECKISIMTGEQHNKMSIMAGEKHNDRHNGIGEES